MTSNSSYNGASSGLEIAKAYSASIAGKIALVTGVSPGGIGDATARAFAHGGASTVIITGRDESKMSAISDSLKKDYPNTRFRSVKLDLFSLKSAQQAAQEILKDDSIPQVDVTVANAGFNDVGGTERKETGDGLELHFGGNHLAHFLFINTLMPKIKEAAKKNKVGETRIVTVSSGSTMTSPIRFSDWQYKNDKPIPDYEKPQWAVLAHLFGLDPEPAQYENNIAYAQSKTANILHAVGLNQHYAKEGIYSFAITPGIVGSTGYNSIADPAMTERFVQLLGIFKNIDQGAATTIVAALDPGLKIEDAAEGFFLDDCQLAMEKCPPWSKDAEAARKLWTLSEEIVKEKLG